MRQSETPPLLLHQLLQVAKALGVILAILFFLLLISGRINYLYLDDVRELVLDISTGAMITNFFHEALSLTVQIAATVIGAALLFRISGITTETSERLSKKWFWRLFLTHLLTSNDQKRLWHLYSGYFLLLLTLLPVLGLYLSESVDFEQLYRESENLEPDEPTDFAGKNYTATLASIPLLTVVLITTRVLSRIGVKVLSTDLGFLVIAIFISESIFLASVRNTPLEIVQNIINPEYPTQGVVGGFVIFGSIFFFALIATLIDWIIVLKLMKLLEKKIKKQSDEVSS